MIKFKQTNGPFGDATSNYAVETDATTVSEFIEQILKERNNEWGEVCIEDKNGIASSICVCEYRYGNITRKASNYHIYGKARIKSIFANGGWSKMSYAVEVVEYNTLPTQSREEYLQVYFGRR